MFWNEYLVKFAFGLIQPDNVKWSRNNKLKENTQYNC